MNIGKYFTELDKASINGFTYPFIVELIGHVQTEISSKLQIHFPLPSHAIINNGVLLLNGDLVTPLDGKKLIYSLYQVSDKQMYASKNSTGQVLVQRISNQDRFSTNGGKLWTTHQYYDLWNTETKK